VHVAQEDVELDPADPHDLKDGTGPAGRIS
jgi:hypothetical protein